MSRIADAYGLDVWVWYPALDSSYADQHAIDRAVELYEQAVARDPGFVQAHVQLALMHGTLYWYGHFDPTPARLARLKAAVEPLAENVSGVGLDVLAAEVAARHAKAYPADGIRDPHRRGGTLAPRFTASRRSAAR